jgi:lipoprotein-anchoring transpeptidase ErfK/SrfK
MTKFLRPLLVAFLALLLAVAVPTNSVAEASSHRWIAINLSTLTASAMQGNRVLYSAPVVAGRQGARTPTGTFTIQRRVLNETMSSATIGIPVNSASGYYYPDVLFTQYFTNVGHAIHYTYWLPGSAFGNRYTSRGCVGMRYHDAQFFWNFATVGTPVSIYW